jgi:hypothetical protein
MNALEIVQQAAITLGYEPVTSIENMQNPNVQRFVGALNRAMEEILKCYDWQALICQKTFFTSDTNLYNPQLKGYDITKIAPDFDSFITSCLYDYTSKSIIPSVTYDKYQSDLALGTAPYARRFVLTDSHICFTPDFENVNAKIGFVYKTAKAVKNNSSGAWEYKEYFSKNDDVSVLDSKLLLRGLLWKFKAEMGYDYGENFRDFQIFLEKLKDQDSARRKLTNSNFNRLAFGEII